MKFGLLDVSAEYDDARRNFRREFDVPLVAYDVPDGERPAVEKIDAAIITGSWASVYWDHDWITALKTWTEDALEGGLPVMGVCFGHQLLADILGGEVVGRDKYELGYHTLDRTADSALFEGVPWQFTALTSHSDDVVALPPGGEKLAENQYSLHAFRKDRAFGVQFHAELDLETARRFVAQREPSGERTPDARETLTEANYEAATETKRIFDNFTAYVSTLREP